MNETLISSETLNLALDALLFLGMAVLWGLWMRNAKRQQRLEQLLAETAAQLEEASRHLDESTRLISAAKQTQSNQATSTSSPATSRRARIERSETESPATASRRHTPSAAVRKAYQPQVPAGHASAPAAGHDAQMSMILRMQREGETPASIADKLDLPLAQVRLLLKLQAAPHQS